MGDAACWQVLGIAPTSDARAIRSAYTAKLKHIDPDRDPGAFIRLRAAYDQALNGGAIVEPAAPVIVHEDAPADKFYDQIVKLAGLFDAAAHSEQPWLSKDAKAQLRSCWQDIATDPRMEDVSFYGRAELDVARLIAGWGRFAVGLVIPATEFFGWTEREINVATDNAIVEVVRRYRLVRFLQVVRKPVNAHHAAWVELTTKGYPGSGRGCCDPVLVHELLVIIREIWPELETELDPLRVEAWKDNTAGHVEDALRDQRARRRLRIVLLVWIGLFGLVMIARAIAETMRG